MHDFGAQNGLHAHRRDIINSKTLCQHAINAELPQFILLKKLSVKTWYPVSLSIRDSFNPVPIHEMLLTPQDKSAADPGSAGYAVHKDAKTHQLGEKVRPPMTRTKKEFPLTFCWCSDLSRHCRGCHRCRVPFFWFPWCIYCHTVARNSRTRIRRHLGDAP